MLKRFTKSGKKQNKSGVILVTILFILMVAFVLIGSALIMTAKSRSRLYTFAEGGQARLTCTAAAELFENALQEQQITDAQFLQLCGNGSTPGATIYFTDTQIPGMGGTETGSPDNYTKAVFGKNGSKLTVAFTTVIGTETENILLTYEKNPGNTQSSPFAFQVELGEGGELDKVKIGHDLSSGGRYMAEDNLIVSRGNGMVDQDHSYFYSTFVTTKPMRSASGTEYYGDLIYAGANAGVDTTPHSNGSNQGSGAMMMGTGNVYFIDCNQALYGTGSTNECFTGGGNGSNVVFCNVGTGNGNFGGQGFTGFADGSIYRLSYDSSTDTFAAGSTSVTINGGNAGLPTGATTPPGASSATNKDISYYIDNLDVYLNTEHVNSNGTTRPSCYVEFASSAGLNISGTGAGNPALPLNASAGVYSINGPTTINDTYHINLQDGNVVVYVSGKMTITQNHGFVVSGDTGTNTSSRCTFVLSPGASIEIQGDAGREAGFWSENCHNSGLNDAVDQTQAPLTYIVGAGTNGVSMPHGQIYCNANQGCVIEAMVALYAYSDGTNTINTTNTNDAGAFNAYQGPSVRFYGRIIAKTIRNELGSFIEIPYCPQFSSGENPNMLYRAVSEYHISSFDYFYENSDSSHSQSGLHE